MGEPIPALVRCPDWCDQDAGHEYVRTQTSPDPWRVHTSTTVVGELAVVVVQREDHVSAGRFGPARAVAGRAEVTVVGSLHTASTDTMTELVRSVMAARAACGPLWPLLRADARVWDARSRRWGTVVDEQTVNGVDLGEGFVAVRLDAYAPHDGLLRVHHTDLRVPVPEPVEAVAAHA